MAVESPYQFRPMDELRDEGRKVEIAKADGQVVIGWLFCGMPNVARSFWTNGKRGSESIEAIGWREIEKDWSAYRKDDTQGAKP